MGRPARGVPSRSSSQDAVLLLHAAPGGRGAGAVEKQLAGIPAPRITTATSGRTSPTGARTSPAEAVTTCTRPRSSRSRRNHGISSAASLGVAKAGIQALLHTQTDVAIEGKLRQIEKLDKEGVSIRPLRWALMHMEGVTVDQIERMKKLNMFIAVHPREIVTGGLLRRVWGDKALAMPPLRGIQDSGIMWGLGTDAFEVNQFRPFQTLYWAVTGKMVGGTVVNTHTVSREAALIAHTRSNAYLFFRENDLGSIQPGRFADLVATDRDYLTVPADQIKDIKPVLTMVGGRVVYDAATESPTATR